MSQSGVHREPDETTTIAGRPIDRRRALTSIGAVSLAAMFGPRVLAALGEDADAATACVLTPEVTDGPLLDRRDSHRGYVGRIVVGVTSTA